MTRPQTPQGQLPADDPVVDSVDNSAINPVSIPNDSPDDTPTSQPHPDLSHRVSVVFTPAGIRVATKKNATLLDAARAGGVDLDSVCGGRGLCGRCQVIPVEGNLPKWEITSSSSSLSPPGTIENDYRNRRLPLEAGYRLGCQAKILDSLVVDVPESSQIHRPVVCKTIDLGNMTLDPAVTLHYVKTQMNSLGEEISDTAAIVEALHTDWDLADIDIEIPELQTLKTAFGSGNRDVTVVLHNHKRVLDVRPGYSDTVLGVAIDVGSTTLAGYLVDLSTGELLADIGRMNPQIRFGEDLMSRVSYAMLNPNGTTELTKAVREAIDNLVDELCDTTNTPREHLHELVLVGNPIMHHLVLGLDPTQLGTAPFTLTTDTATRGRATDIGVSLPNAALYVAPCIAGHVGADTAAVVLAESPHHSEDSVLIVDVGTNAEIVLGNERQLLAASSPTGPAFEGAQISCGQRATAGAIERVRIDPYTFEPRFKVIGCDLWSNDPGFETALSSGGLTISGICGSGIIEAIAEMFLVGIIDHRGVIQPVQVQDTTQQNTVEQQPRVVADGRTFSYILQHDPMTLSITQKDVRAIQLAKAALRAGIDLLCEHSGIEKIDQVRLTGAFGAHINPTHAMLLGIVPDMPIEKIRHIGNAAGVGAVRMLLSNHQKNEIEQIAKTITKIETATEPRFQELFVAAMAFPHSNTATPNLAGTVKLPSPNKDKTTRRNHRRKRRTTTK